MKVTRDQQVAVGKALKALEAEGKTARAASLDGQAVDPAAARQVVEGEPAPPTEKGALGRMADRVERGSDKVSERLSGSRLGEWASRAMRADPERVSHPARLVVDTVDGERIELEIPVVHLKATEWLQRSSITAELGALLPVAGHFVPAAASLVSALGSLLARAGGDPALADAMMATARKHLALTGAKMIPGVGGAAALLAVVEDRKNLRELANPSVQAVAQLRPLPVDEG